MEQAVYKPLNSKKAPAGTTFHTPSTFAAVTAQSPAICVMTDLRQVSAATIGPDASLTQANQVMISRGVRLLLVVERTDELAGLITARDTEGDRVIKMIGERGIKYGDLQVRDLMIRREDIDIFDVAAVLRSEVGHIIATLKALGRQHALVGHTDPATNVTRIRGIFSATQIGRQLGVPVQTFEVAKTFAEIEAALVK
jgi:predicted transcriptional regulator